MKIVLMDDLDGHVSLPFDGKLLAIAPLQAFPGICLILVKIMKSDHVQFVTWKVTDQTDKGEACCDGGRYFYNPKDGIKDFHDRLRQIEGY